MSVCSEVGCGKPLLARGWCQMHYNRWRRNGHPGTIRSVGPEDEVARFWVKVNKDGPLPTWAPFLGPCWLWTGGHIGGGYGQFNPGSRIDNSRRKAVAHRYAYELLVGPVPDGLELDHLCRVRPCCNPAHLEPVTHAENIARGLTVPAANLIKTECPAGHPYDEVNTYVHQGRRACKECRREHARRYKARVRHPELLGAH